MEQLNRAANIAAATRFTAGQLIRWFYFQQETYTTAEIVSIDPDTGMIGLHLTKRDTSRRWAAQIGAASLAASIRASALASTVLQLSEAAVA